MIDVCIMEVTSDGGSILFLLFLSESCSFLLQEAFFFPLLLYQLHFLRFVWVYLLFWYGKVKIPMLLQGVVVLFFFGHAHLGMNAYIRTSREFLFIEWMS